MSVNNLLAIVFALLSALTIALGTVLRHYVGEEPDPDAPVRSTVWRSIIQPLWWLGLFCALGGYGLQIVALGFGTLLVVQPILVLSLMFTLPLAARVEGRRISRVEALWAALLTAAVAVLVVLGRPSPGLTQPPERRWVIALLIGAGAMLALFAVTRRWLGNEMALILGAITGGIMGYVAVLSKAVVDVFTHQGLSQLVGAWEFHALLGGAVIGVAVQQASFNLGDLRDSLPAMTIVEPIVAFALGYAILGERVQAHGAQWILMAAALIIMIAGTIVLSRSTLTSGNTAQQAEPRGG
ncbi:DMT family transporter [Corynebacterium heidelbergense]|uniref:Multidrug DMT transporter permease n=1 Tax=Corynebacterium heidelbergense TaxID=2055947 RepID=A0A364VAZ4_9CORY|nr:DMT family transporter [Corynebacterium heidelbergense]RAV33833.1 hypothetical protein CWC39_06460 [Corynebacterium heidelbergense]WCZ37505.1 hypothetical protein CHEID_09905 [Corynebacterium heidelbergense]